jgi:hypothetical protein
MSNAILSPCGQYRYTLRRSLGLIGMRQVLWVMLNPSTADATQDDNTIRRCKTFSQAWGFAEMVVVNLYAYRSTEPERLWDVADPVGPDNDDYIRELAKRSDLTLCAWGQPGPDRGRAHHVRGLIEGVSGAPSFLRQNKDGSPGHPLYLPGKLTPQVWV